MSFPEPECQATPAVVNPTLRWEPQEWISLDGVWDFAMDPMEVGISQKWFLPAEQLPANNLFFDKTITVPGCWEAQGIGGKGKCIRSTPEDSPALLAGCYYGAAWYKKKVSIPASWSGKEIWLKIGGVNAQGWFYVNGTYIGTIESYCGSYELIPAAPGTF